MQQMASCGIFQHKSASRERGQFWQKIATNRNDQNFSLILCTFWDWFMTKLRKKIQGTELAGEEKTECTCTFLIERKLQQKGKRQLKI